MSNRISIILSTVAFFMCLVGLIYPKTQKIGVVDINLIVSEQAKALAEQNPGTTFSAQQIRKITDNIRDQMGSFCHQNNIILISKGSVLGGNIEEYTKEIYENLQVEGGQG